MLVAAAPTIALCAMAFSLPRGNPHPSRTHTLRASPRLAISDSKASLLSAISTYDAATKKDGVPSVDFGVSGGELDENSRAPRDLLAAGAFHAVSPAVGAAADRVVEAIEAVASVNPTPEPTRGFGTADGAATCPLHGRWSNAFTTAADATFSPDSKRGDASVSNEVDATSGRTTNIIEFKTSGAEPPPLESLKVRLSAKAVSPSRIELIFRRVRARLNVQLFGLRFGLTLILPVPGPFLTRLLFLFRRTKRPPPAHFDVLYLDEDLRVHRTGQGNLFVQRRAA